MTRWSIQLLRFIAAILVLLFHLHLMRSGYKGVDIFFVISGFVMYLKLFTFKRTTATVFFINRLTKIFFLYWIALLLLYMVQPFQFDTRLLSSLFLLPGHGIVFGLSWTLTYELYFYFLIGAIAYLAPDKYARLILFFILLLTTVITVLDLHFKIHIPGTTFPLGKNTWEFFMGVFCAYLSGRFRITAKRVVLLPVICLLFLLFIWIDIPLAIRSITATVYGLLSLLLLFFLVAYEKNVIINQKLAAVFKLLGDASYAIYLFGPLVAMTFPANGLLLKGINIVITILAGIFVNRIIEKNGLPWIRKKMYGSPPA